MQKSMMMMEGRKKRGIRKENGNKIWKEEDLSGMELASLPNHPSFNLACITKLDLSCNNLESLPESAAARLVNLVELDIHSNQLKRLPNSIGCLSKLKRLDASGNSLDSLPNTIQNCRSLEELLINFNQLTQLPDSLGLGLSNLRLLSVHSNKLTFLPSTAHKLSSLRTLDAHLNSLLTLPKDLHLLPYLHSIDVSQNFQNLNSLPDSIGLLPSLTHLNISYNCITTLPDSLACAAGLRSLKAEGNPLVSPAMEVVESGVDGVREYLIGRMNGVGMKGKGKRGWIWRMARCGMVVDVGRMREMKKDDDMFEMVSEYHSVDGVWSPRRKYMEVLSSPLRIFSRHRSAPASPSPTWK
ncbi:plant intracellular Ras-group-related LRR protein 1-like [Phalaenopsis equestris]|uniref:plant intracellular Ras-group-related LRR protein 1-like n=1 Tax=Phalaenopsis equestris TaxID=78828 RepID=UPI0009E4DD8A|nr:plant intracellular Ras-group-related LRR protein 1-like [Phalaenopsis equestris]